MADILTINEGPNITVTATAGVTPARGNRLTMAADGTVGLAGVGIAGEYVAMYTFDAAGATHTVRLLNAQGTQVVQSTAAAIAVGDTVYSAANGTVSNTAAGAILLGIAKTAVGGGGGLLIIVPTP